MNDIESVIADVLDFGRIPVAAAVGASLIGLAACQSGEFDEAPRAEAPEEPLEASSRQPRRKKAARQQDLPSNHPPVGGPQGEGGTPSRGSQPTARPGSAASSSSSSSSSDNSSDRASLPIDWSVPTEWKEVEPSSSMRLAEYQIPPAEGAEPGTLAVFHFGARGGGSVDANIDRWLGQFEVEGGGTARERAEIDERTIDGLKVHTVRVSGTYDPGMGMNSGGAKENYRMMAAIVETSKGAVFFKAVGPEKSLEQQSETFETFVGSIEKSGG